MTIKTTRHPYYAERAFDGEGRCIRATWRDEMEVSTPPGCFLVGCFYEDDDLILVWRERWWSSAALAIAGIIALFAVAALLAWLRARFRPGNEREGWEEGARTAMVRGLDNIVWLMECHSARRAACAGFVAALGPESLGVRLAVLRGRLRPIEPAPGMARSFAELDERAQGAEGWT